jgi:hypothetical protein
VKRFLSLCVLSIACGGADGDSVPNDITNEKAPYRAAIKAVGDEGITTVSIDLYDGDSFDAKPLVLAQGDTLRARADGREVQFQRREGALEGGYVAVLTGSEPGTQIDITLESDKLGEAAAKLRLPDRFTLTAPSSGAAPDLAEPIEYAWEDGKAGDSAEAQYEIACASGGVGRGHSSHGEDSGEEQLVIPTKDMAGPCSLVLGVERQAFGEMRGVWGGVAVAAQRSTVSYDGVDL